MSSVLHKLYEEHKSLADYLQANRQPSYASSVESTFIKVLIVASASFLEEEVKRVIDLFCSKASKNNNNLKNFVRQIVIERGYHTLFSWKDQGKGVYCFFRLFGEEVLEKYKKSISVDRDLNIAAENFIFLGMERNKLVHQNFANLSIEYTAAECFQKFEKTLLFINYIEKMLLEYVT
jgi:hypothetical protein